MPSGALTLLITMAALLSFFAAITTTDAADAGNDPAMIVHLPNPNIFQSPYTWRNQDGSAIAPTGGSYLKGVVKGTTSIRANIDTSLNVGLAADDMPSLKVTVDDLPAVFVQFPPGTKQVTLAMTTPESHRYRVEVIGGNQGKGDGWKGTSFQTKFDSLQFDAGATLSPPELRTKRALVIGDSNIQAYFGGAQSGPYFNYVDYSMSWPTYVMFAFKCEYGQIGVGGTGWIHPGQGGYPAVPDWWKNYDEKHGRDFSPQPDYVWVALGANDHNADPANLQRIIQDWLAEARKIFPDSQILVVVPFHGENRAAVTAAAVAAGTNDAHVHLVDLGTEIQSAIPFVPGHPTWMTGDGLHIRAIYQGMLAAGVAQKSQAALDRLPSVHSPAGN